MKHLRILAILVFLIPIQAESEELYFKRVGTNEGLSQNTVNEIIQDSRGFVWLGTKDGLNRYDGKHFQTFRHVQDSSDGLGDNHIRNLCEDPDGRIWVGTNSGLYVYDTYKDTFKEISAKSEGGAEISGHPILDIEYDGAGRMWISVESEGVWYSDIKTGSTVCAFETEKPLRSLKPDTQTGRIWFSYSRGGLFYTDDGFKTVNQYLLPDGSKIYPDDVISYIHVSDFNKIYLGLEESGIVELNKSTGEMSWIKLSEHPVFVRYILQHSADELWIGSEFGLYIYNITSKKVKHFTSLPFDPFSLSDNSIHSMMKDREGGIWIGTFFEGVNYMPRRTPDFNKYYFDGRKGGLGGQRIRETCQDKDGNIWIATEDAGLYRYSPRSGEFRFIPPSSSFSNIQDLLIDGDELLIATFANGLIVMDTKTFATKKYDSGSTKGKLFSNSIFSLAKTSKGYTYIGTMHGLQYIDPETNSFGYIPKINGGKMVNDIVEDTDGNLWVGTVSHGLYVLKGRDGEWVNFTYGNGEGSGLPSNNITGIFEDSSKQIWITTDGAGFCLFDRKTEKFIPITSENGLPSDVIYRIIEDNDNNFWISTNKGLVMFNPESNSVERVFTTEDGLLSNQFNYSSGIRDDSGLIWFGCVKGLISFRPEYLLNRKPLTTSNVYVTEFNLLSGYDKNDGRILPESIICTDEITLKYDQNAFSLQLAAPSFSRDRKIVYTLEGVDNRWMEYDNNHIVYSNLSFGKYTFKAKIEGEDDTLKTLKIKVKPPLWETAVAKIIYALVLLGIVLLLSNFMHRRSLLKRKKYISAYARKKEKEMYDGRIAFFTAITHEIRTPLTLIKGPLDNIMSREDIDPEIAKDLAIMNRNTSRLTVLVNELLDFQRIEKDNVSLHPIVFDLAELVDDVFDNFSSGINYEKKDCIIDTERRNIFASVDREAFNKIFSNLLINAMKYSDRKIEIKLAKEKGFAVLSVKNDGKIVPLDKRESVFAPFYRHSTDSSGTGIGLYLARTLAEMHGGGLRMSDNAGDNEFILTLPLYSDNDSEETQSFGDSDDEEYMTDTEDQDELDDLKYEVEGNPESGYLILVVDDDREMRHFIKNQIAKHWKVIAASNGRRALKILEKEDISLIVSDVMMPVMNGIEFCKVLKKDFRYTHIPFVLLSAKTSAEAKIEGVNAGADAYIEKPFSMAYLVSVIINLIKSRESLVEAFLATPLAEVTTSGLSKEDTEFVNRVRELVCMHLSETDFKMSDIAGPMNMSRATLYRKINGVLNITPNDYLKVERLKKAAELLATNNYHISEICYMTGFSSSSYFAKCFYDQFGEKPKVWADKFKNKQE